jgi:predicted nucleotidyltransferase
LALAQRAADVLHTEFGVSRVSLFGSVLRPGLFHERSDVDLAVWGLDERRYLRALAALLDLEPDFSVDLVEFEHAQPGLQRLIEREGQPL